MKINEISKEQLAYIAGIFDGEGSVLYNTKKLTFAVTQGERGIELLTKLQEIIGKGSVTLHQKPQKSNHQTIYRYRLQSNKMAKDLFQRILPYLIVKKEVVTEALNK